RACAGAGVAARARGTPRTGTVRMAHSFGPALRVLIAASRLLHLENRPRTLAESEGTIRRSYLFPERFLLIFSSASRGTAPAATWSMGHRLPSSEGSGPSTTFARQRHRVVKHILTR